MVLHANEPSALPNERTVTLISCLYIGLRKRRFRCYFPPNSSPPARLERSIATGCSLRAPSGCPPRPTQAKLRDAAARTRIRKRRGVAELAYP
eukprot:759650-Hanusia_phi.AAC.1